MCLEAATKLARDNLMDQNEACRKFLERILPEAFRKLLTSNATQRWMAEIQVNRVIMDCRQGTAKLL